FDPIKVYPVTVALDDKLPELRPGMSAEVTFLGDSRPNVLRVPVEALFNPRGQHRERICFLQVGGQFQERAVLIGFAGNTLAEITNGLQEGDRVLRSVPELAEGVRRWLNGESLRPEPARGRAGAPGGRSR